MWILLSLACGGSPEPMDRTTFVRDGWVHSGSGGRLLPDGRRLTERSWTPGERVGGEIAPRVSDCVALYSLPLGDVAQQVARGVSAPDTALSFSPDGEVLAVGSYLGEILLVESWTGRVLARKQLSEALVKRVVWSADGQTLYAGEQSPDAYVYAFDRDLNIRWRVRMADRVETASPGADDLFGVYQLPGIYGLVAVPDGILVSAAHGWNTPAGRRNQSQLVKLDRRGEVLGAWPNAPADATFLHMVARDDAVLVSVGRSADGPPPEDLPVGGVQVLDAQLKPLSGLTVPALPPYFETVFVWQAVELLDGVPVIGLGDGRLVLGARTLALGTPLEVGDVPIAAAVAHVQRSGDAVFAVTGGTQIPYGASRPDLAPPEVHPGANTLYAVRDGEIAWRWQGPHALQGLTVQGAELLVGAGSRVRDARTDLFGALLFSTKTKGLTAFCATTSPVFFSHALSGDRLVAVAEVPEKRGEQVRGTYQLTVFR